MTATKLDPRSLTSEERAIVEEMVTRLPVSWGVLPSNLEGNSPYWLGYLTQPEWSQAYESAFARILARRAIFGETESEKAEPAPEQAIRILARHLSNCAQDATVATAVIEVLHWLEEPASEPAKVECDHHWDGKTRLCVYCRLPQPANARVTEELEKVLGAAQDTANYRKIFPLSTIPGKPTGAELDLFIAAVRAQAAEAGKVRMPKVRELLDHLDTEIGFSNKIDVLTQAAFAELDAAEGKGEGRG